MKEFKKNKDGLFICEECGEEVASKSIIVKDKIKSTNLIKYGMPCTLHTPENINKKENYWLYKYGVTHPTKSIIVKDKIKQTCLLKYGVENPAQCLEIFEKLLI